MEVRDHAMECDMVSGVKAWHVLRTVQGVNTEVAEQTFTQLRYCRNSLRKMGAWSSQVLLAFIVTHMNATRLQDCGHPRPSGMLTDRWSPVSRLGPPLSKLFDL